MARSQNEAAAPAGEAPTGVNRRVGWWALLFFLGCYLLTFSGRPGGGDQLTMYEMTRSLAERGALDLDPTAQGWLKAGRGGRFYSPYPPGQPLLAVPLYWLGEAAAWAKPGLDPGQATSFTVTLLAPIAAAAGLAAIYAILIQLGYRRRTAFAVAAIVGFGSFYWPLSKNFNSEPAAVAVTLWGVWFWYRFQASRRPLEAALCAVFIACSVLIRLAFVPVAGALFLYALYRMAGHRGRLSRPGLCLVAFSTPFLTVTLFLLWYNWLRFGGVAQTGYRAAMLEPTEIIPWNAALGMLVSPGKGLLWFAPILVPAPVAWLAWRQSRPPDASLILVIAVAVLAPLCFFKGWPGGWAWGPRYNLLMVPVLALPLAALWERSGLSGRRWRAALVGLAILGGILQLPAVVAPVELAYLHGRQQHGRRIDNQARSPLIWRPRESLMVVQWQLAALLVRNRLTGAHEQPPPARAELRLTGQKAANFNLRRFDLWFEALYLHGIGLSTLLPALLLLMSLTGYAGWRIRALLPETQQ